MPPVGPQVASYSFPPNGRFRGQLDVAGASSAIFRQGWLTSLRNFHVVEEGRLQKRRGHKPFIAAQVQGANAIQGLINFEFGTNSYLVAVSAGKIKYISSGAWSDITGSLSPGTGDNNQCRFTQFTQGANNYLVGTGPNNTNLWRWVGSGNATLLTPAGTALPAPTQAKDIAEWRGRLWAINTDVSSAIVEYSDDGVLDSWNAGNYIYCSRSSPGVGLARHSDGALLVFYQDSVHRIEFNPEAGEVFTQAVVDGRVGCASTFSICTDKGITYFASERGIFRVRNPYRPAEYLSYDIQDYWNDLNQSRLAYVWGFVRGEPWNEIVWLVSTGSNTQHNAAIVYNPVLESWTIFDSTSGYLKFNCGCSFKDTTGRLKTMLGRYDGRVSEAWGNANHDTGNRDNDSSGAAVQTEIATGYLDFGYAGLKRLLEVWMEVQTNAEKTFTLRVETIGGSITATSPQSSVTVGTAGDRLSVDFIFDTSVLASSDSPEQAVVRGINTIARMFKMTITEDASNMDTAPHTVNNFRFIHVPRGMKFQPGA